MKNLESKEVWEPYLDKWGLLVQGPETNHDGGDSAHRFGLLCFLLIYSRTVRGNTPWGETIYMWYGRCMEQYHLDFGRMRRHPDPSKWYSNWRTTSRDQMNMLQAAMFAMEDAALYETTLKRIFEVNNGFHDNVTPNYDENKDIVKTPDVVTPSQLSKFARMKKTKWAYFILDWFLIIDLILAWLDDVQCKKEGGRTDYYTMLIVDLLATKMYPALDTVPAKIARLLFNRTDGLNAVKWIFTRTSEPPLWKYAEEAWNG